LPRIAPPAAFAGAKMTVTSPFRKFGAAVCRDQLTAKLRQFCFDGTECHRVVNAELQGPEHEIAASNIRHANLSQYRDTIPINAVIEIVGKFFDDGEMP
jgi:hypothetical protein